MTINFALIQIYCIDAHRYDAHRSINLTVNSSSPFSGGVVIDKFTETHKYLAFIMVLGSCGTFSDCVPFGGWLSYIEIMNSATASVPFVTKYHIQLPLWCLLGFSSGTMDCFKPVLVHRYGVPYPQLETAFNVQHIYIMHSSQ